MTAAVWKGVFLAVCFSAWHLRWSYKPANDTNTNCRGELLHCRQPCEDSSTPFPLSLRPLAPIQHKTSFTICHIPIESPHFAKQTHHIKVGRGHVQRRTDFAGSSTVLDPFSNIANPLKRCVAQSGCVVKMWHRDCTSWALVHDYASPESFERTPPFILSVCRSI